MYGEIFDKGVSKDIIACPDDLEVLRDKPLCDSLAWRGNIVYTSRQKTGCAAKKLCLKVNFRQVPAKNALIFAIPTARAS